MPYNEMLEDNSSSAQPPAQAVADNRRPIVTTALLSIEKVVGYEAENNSSILAYAIHGDELLFMVFGGAETALHSTITLLNDKNKQIHLVGPNLDVIVKASSGVTRQTSVASRQRITFAAIASPKLNGVEPGEKLTYVMGTPGEKSPMENPATLSRIIGRLSKFMPVGTIPEWYETIVRLGFERILETGSRDPLLHRVMCAGCSVWAIAIDAAAWQKVVSTAVANGTLRFPNV